MNNCTVEYFRQASETSRAIWFYMKIETGSSAHFLPEAATVFFIVTLPYFVIVYYFTHVMSKVFLQTKKCERTRFF